MFKSVRSRAFIVVGLAVAVMAFAGIPQLSTAALAATNPVTQAATVEKTTGADVLIVASSDESEKKKKKKRRKGGGGSYQGS